MKLAGIGLFFLLGILCSSIFACELNEIELLDGSMISGEIINALERAGVGRIPLIDSK